jgi:uncharacterized protein
MKANPKMAWNAERLDMRAFAQAAGSLQAVEPLGRFDRLAEEAAAHDGLSPDAQVHWQAHGDMRPAATGGAPAPWLHLEAQATIPLTCQRCLGPVATPLVVDRWFRFVADEATAAALDDECEEDLLALEPRPSLRDLLEDELLMAMPLVPMHEHCPAPVQMQAGELAEDGAPAPDERPHPFADLARLKK